MRTDSLKKSLVRKRRTRISHTYCGVCQLLLPSAAGIIFFDVPFFDPGFSATSSAMLELALPASVTFDADCTCSTPEDVLPDFEVGGFNVEFFIGNRLGMLSNRLSIVIVVLKVLPKEYLSCASVKRNANSPRLCYRRLRNFRIFHDIHILGCSSC